MSKIRHGLLAAFAMLVLAVGAVAQQPPSIGKQQLFPTPEAAADALNDAAKRGDSKALQAILGAPWGALTPLQSDGFKRDLAAYFSQWDRQHKVTIDPASNGAKAIVEVGTPGWTLPMPIVKAAVPSLTIGMGRVQPVVKDGTAWRFDSVAGFNEMVARELGRNEFGAIQTLLAIGDAERDYAVLDPMKTGGTAYARRLLSSPGKKDGLYWPAAPGQPQSPLGAQVAHSQPDGKFPGDHYGYNFRLLYGQGSAAPGGARDYIIKGRMIGGFGAIAWPLRYGETGIMTFVMGSDGIVYQQDLGPNTAQRAASIIALNPDKGWEKADMTPP